MFGTSPDFKKTADEWKLFASTFPSDETVTAYFHRVGIESFRVPMIDTLFGFLDVQTAIGGEGGMPEEFARKANAVDIDIRTSKLDIAVATHAVGWTNNGEKLLHVPSRIMVPSALVQAGQPPLDLLDLRNKQMLRPSNDYDEETNEHMQEMCRLRNLNIGGDKKELIKRLQQYDERQLQQPITIAITAGNQPATLAAATMDEQLRLTDRTTEMTKYVELKSYQLLKTTQPKLFDLCIEAGLKTTKSWSKRRLVDTLILHYTKKKTILPNDFQRLIADKDLAKEVAKKKNKN